MLCIPSTRFLNFHQSVVTVKTVVGRDSLDMRAWIRCLGEMLIMGSYELCSYVTWTAIKCLFMGVVHLQKGRRDHGFVEFLFICTSLFLSLGGTLLLLLYYFFEPCDWCRLPFVAVTYPPPALWHIGSLPLMTGLRMSSIMGALLRE